MQQWDVVVVIGTLMGLFATVIGPIVKLTRAITKLTATMENMEKNVGELSTDNKEDHERIWAHAREQDLRLCEHETRIRVIEEDR